MARAKEETLGVIHEMLAQQMLDILKGEEPPTAQEMAQIRQFLKDNEITADMTQSEPSKALKAELDERDSDFLKVVG